MENLTIEIKTTESEGICPPDGRTYIHKTWSLGPRNLMSAIKILDAHSEAMDICLGKIGHVDSWIQIGEFRFNRHLDLIQCERIDDLPVYFTKRIDQCKKYIASIFNGDLKKEIIAREKEY